MTFKTPVFNLQDLQTDKGVERVFLQFLGAVKEASKVPQLPSKDQLVRSLAPGIRNELQATGDFPLNLQDLLPDQDQSEVIVEASLVFESIIGNNSHELAELENLVHSGETPRSWSDIAVIQDTRGNRAGTYPPAAFAEGSLYVETDSVSHLIYVNQRVSGALTWVYAAGRYSDTLANLISPATADEGLIFEVIDYDHLLVWGGAAWTWGPGETGDGTKIVAFVRAPANAGGNAWQVCDGSAVAVLNQDGTTTNVTTPDYTTAAYLKLIDSGNTLGPTAASGVSASVVATNQNTVVTAHTVKEITTVAGGSGDFLFEAQADAAHVTHGHTQDAHTHGPNTLELRNTELLAYMRR